jgi:hypothetical protein
MTTLCKKKEEFIFFNNLMDFFCLQSVRVKDKTMVVTECETDQMKIGGVLELKAGLIGLNTNF